MARNTYGGNCLHCGLWVAPGAGHFRRVRGGWVVHHANFKRQERDGGVTCATAARQASSTPSDQSPAEKE